MKLYVQRIPKELEGKIHGIDYGFETPCGRKHEFQTRNCCPVVYTEEQFRNHVSKDDFVELVMFREDEPLMPPNDEVL